MKSADQLPLFEPTGAELAILADRHYRDALRNSCREDLSLLRGFTSSAAYWSGLARAEFDLSHACECAYQFESLAGLV